jgi:glycosyltransferase involved in cell wall biosynthesis
MPTPSPAQALKIGILAPISWRVPPRSYGPWEQFVSLLTEGLVQRGIDVTLFATGDSITKATLSSVVPTGYSEDQTIDVKVAECLHLAALFERAAEFDLIHNSYDFLPLCFSRLIHPPMVTTIHGFSSEKILPVYQKYNVDGHYVAISDANRHASLKYAATIHHGIDFSALPLATGARDYLLFFGRIHPDKGTREAIVAARRANMPLVIAGIIQDKQYFEGAIAPHIDGVRVRFLGPVEKEQKAAVLGGARALLHLISFDEPFGFSVVEAMACGTPVVATNRGSMRELIIEGTNGTLVDPDQDVDVPRDRFEPRAVRASVERRFNQDRMVDAYLALYREVVNSKRAEGRAS